MDCDAALAGCWGWHTRRVVGHKYLHMSIEQPPSSSRNPEAPQSPAGPEAPWWGRIGLLWGLFVPLCVAAQTLLLPIGPNDFWYHARAGRFIVEHSSIPTRNLFTQSPPWVSPDTPFHFQSWISEAGFFVLLRAGGLSAIVWARTFCLALAFALVAASAWQRARAISQRSGSTMSWDSAAKIAAGAGLWALAMSNNNFDARPQMFSVPLFAAWSLLLWRWRFVTPSERRKYLCALWIVLALWVNVHGAFVTAILLSGAYAVGATLDAWRLKSSEASRQAREVARDAWILLSGSLLAACLNPRGVGIFAYVRQLATLQSNQKYIQEWQAPEFSLEEWNSMVFYIAPLAALALALLAQRRARAAKASASASTWARPGAVSLAEWAVAALLLAMALRDKRSILWFALWFAPLWASLWAAAVNSRARKASASPAPRAVQVVNAMLALGLCASLGLCAPSIKAAFPWPAAFRARFAPTPQGEFPRGFGADPALLLDRATPVEAVAWLLKNPSRHRLWHDMVFGSYLMWAADGRIVPMSDPRVELYPDAFWDDYARLSAGPPDAPQVLARRGFSDALLDRKLQAPLIQRLLGSGRWKIVFSSPPAFLLRQQRR